MHKQIFVNLPIKDMARSRAFFSALGYSFNPAFSNEKGAAVVLGGTWRAPACGHGLGHQGVDLGAAFAVQAHQNFSAVMRVSDGFAGERGKKLVHQDHGVKVLAQDHCSAFFIAERRVEAVAQGVEKSARSTCL